MRDIHERLSKIKETITNSSFKEGKGLGNEIGFYIFDYEPKYEMLVREYVYNLKRHCPSSMIIIKSGLNLVLCILQMLLR